VFGTYQDKEIVLHMPAPAASTFSTEQLREAKARIVLAGFDSVAAWAARQNVDPALARKILAGSRACLRGESKRIADLLGLKREAPRSATGQPAESLRNGLNTPSVLAGSVAHDRA
jgi:gp16 family phage-associated protein